MRCILGAFGQKLPWSLSPHKCVPKIPGDVKKVASSNTLQVLLSFRRFVETMLCEHGKEHYLVSIATFQDFELVS